MAAKQRDKASPAVPMPLVVGVLVIVVVAIGVLAWRTFATPASPTDGMTDAQKKEAFLKAQKTMNEANPNGKGMIP